MLKWWHRRLYERRNRELVQSGSSERWVELVPGDWRCVDTVELQKQYPSLRVAKKVQIADKTFYLRNMRNQPVEIQERQMVWQRAGMVMEHIRARFDQPIPPARKGLVIISSGRERYFVEDETSPEE